jgi:hypothetical protein
MNTQNAFGSNSNSTSPISVTGATHNAEATLRLIAALPSPEGLENRVIAGVRSAPRSGRVLGWPALLSPSGGWLRTAAAAAIVFVIVGGGWGVYSRVQPSSAIVAPPVAGAAAGFSNAGAVRVPQTLPAPLVVQPAPVQVTQPQAAEPANKAHGEVVPGKHHDAKLVAGNKTSVQTSGPNSK